MQCEVKGVHRRATDGRFVYIVEVGLYLMLRPCVVSPPLVGQVVKQYGVFGPSYVWRIF